MSNASEQFPPMEAAAEVPTAPQVEEAGPLSHMNHDFLETFMASHHSHPQDPPTQSTSSEQSGEQALESHEVMELQAFSERKEWIMEKIKLLEGMPPIGLFSDLDAVRASTAAVSGLPTREQLEQWLVEHDKIEKETEIFDSGELKKFKKFTMAASKRNLSPQDTDIIELTLTTISEFDKLLHLLRDRSENLDLLGIRLTWEEQRCAAWADRRQLLLDLQAFLSQRARWSPSVYDSLHQAECPVQSPAPAPAPALSRRGSATSLTSETSNSFPSGFSRGARFKHAEALSREAAQFAGRISSLRHGKIAVAGKALDKFIENSRRPVPDEFLDEQDKLEEQGISEMENVGRFVMSVVTQWRKADELYVETMKDQASAQSLLDDIDTAQLAHPSSRQDSVFSARTSSIIKRLSCREKPSSHVSSFLSPTHPLFPDQRSVNDSITKVLAEELEVGLSAAQRLERSAREYHAAYEAVRKAEHSVASANELSDAYDSVLQSILKGVESSDGDGSPPDLTSESCLRETKHAAFLALLPSLLQRLGASDEEARSILPTARASLLGLGDINVEPDFKDRLVSAIQRLHVVKIESERACAAITARVGILRDARRIWVSAGSILADLGAIRGDTSELIGQQRWKSSTASHLPPTPESVNASLPLSNKTLEHVVEQLTLLREKFVRDVQAGISSLPLPEGTNLRMYLLKRRDGLSTIFEHTQQMTRLADSVNKQALAMTAIRDEAHDLEMRLEGTKTRFDVLAEQILYEPSSGDDLDSPRQDLVSDAMSIQAAYQTFIDSLPHRVVFVSSDASGVGVSNMPNPSPRRRFTSPLDLTLEALGSIPPLGPPIDLAQLDHVIRTDCNAFALHLSTSGWSTLDVVLDARAVDLKLAALRASINLAEERHEALRKTVFAIPDALNSADRLASATAESGPVFDSLHSEISRSFSPIRQLLHKMDVMCRESATTRHLCSSRNQILDDMETRFRAWSDNVKALISEIRHREERLRAAQREQIKRERLEADAAEKLCREQAEYEAKLRAEESANEEREREAAEVAERLRNEQAETEEQIRMEHERAEAAQEQAQKGTDLSSNLSFRSVAVDTFSTWDSDGDIVSPEPFSEDLAEVQSQVATLRGRLLSLGINTVARPSPSSVSPLMTVGKHASLTFHLAEVSNEAKGLPAHTSDVVINAELKSLQNELDASHQVLPQALVLARVGSLVQDCDNVLSDLLEHIDSYPAPPSGPLAGSYISSNMLPPEEQLQGRLAFTNDLIDMLEKTFVTVADEPKASSERQRIAQTWAELESMALDRINGRRSRPGSTLSSGRNSRASIASHRPMPEKKSGQYSALSRNAVTRDRGHVLAPAFPSTTNRNLSRKADPVLNRSSSRLSVVSTNRSVSGPMTSSSRLISSTFASRQRTVSLSSTVSSPNGPGGKKPPEPLHQSPSRASHLRRTVSPTPSDASVASRRSVLGARRPTHPTWGPPPPRSVSSSNPHRVSLKGKLPLPPPRKPYVANPKSKLDVAVGDVVNNLPEDVDIKVEVAHDTWQDRSGKYWIGVEEPRLCFCRILRSQTVMVRVGGGWMELSKFIQTHFADMFRLLPEPMPYLGSREEKWISSSTLLEAAELVTTPPRPPKTPEPSSGVLNRSKRTPHPGSPLTALQFLRRVDGEDGFLRPATPLKGSTLRNQSRASLPLPPLRSPNRAPVWKP
ncbi:hypothetical protein F5148DRAFT_1193951 [Russula earlei]|uniref:Uncharacterized protein n=1 Tax=Russula earlei TaxID=71964 RepID=A0ACC0UAB2_9AGAM|nr:hypothetical protein F5148DRAFT_1193951 [Russula earlei]